MTQEPQPFKFALGDLVVCLTDRESVFVIMSAYPKEGKNFYKVVSKEDGEIGTFPEEFLLPLEEVTAERLMEGD